MMQRMDLYTQQRCMGATRILTTLRGMPMNEHIPENLHAILLDHGFALTESTHSVVSYESDSMVLHLRYNPRERTSSLWVGLKQNDDCEIDNDIICNVFHSNLTIERLPLKQFLENVYLFLRGPGNTTLNDSVRCYGDLSVYTEGRSARYTDDLVIKQRGEAAPRR
jgi:hypothetical protein